MASRVLAALEAAEYWLAEECESATRTTPEEMLRVVRAAIPEAKAAAATLPALRAAESFMAGFEGDPMQEGIGERLAAIRSAIENMEGRAND